MGCLLHCWRPSVAYLLYICLYACAAHSASSHSPDLSQELQPPSQEQWHSCATVCPTWATETLAAPARRHVFRLLAQDLAALDEASTAQNAVLWTT